LWRNCVCGIVPTTHRVKRHEHKRAQYSQTSVIMVGDDSPY
jgi:hypothetical protein